MRMKIRRIYRVSVLVFLAACESREPEPPPVVEGAGLPELRTIPEPEVVDALSPELRRLIADMLFSGLQSLDADRLLEPRSDSAYEYFREVLQIQPDNEIALEGMQSIVQRYLELALEAANRGNFANAEIMLGRAELIDASHPGIASTRAALAAERDSGDLFFPLDERALLRRGEAVRGQLAEIAARVRELDAFTLITAPNDELARWIYSTMRGSVPGYRLRGNIEISNTTLIRLRLPAP